MLKLCPLSQPYILDRTKQKVEAGRGCRVRERGTRQRQRGGRRDATRCDADWTNTRETIASLWSDCTPRAARNRRCRHVIE